MRAKRVEVFGKRMEREKLDSVLRKPTDMRIFAIAQAMYLEGYTVDRIHDLTKIDKVRGCSVLYELVS